MWLSSKLTTIRVFSWLRENWQAPFLAIWTIAVWVLTRRNSSAAIETLRIKDRANKSEIDLLKGNHSTELLQRDAITKKYLEVIKNIESKKNKFDSKLESEMRKRVKKIVEDAKGDDNEIKKQISEKFDFNYID